MSHWSEPSTNQTNLAARMRQGSAARRTLSDEMSVKVPSVHSSSATSSSSLHFSSSVSCSSICGGVVVGDGGQQQAIIGERLERWAAMLRARASLQRDVSARRRGLGSV